MAATSDIRVSQDGGQGNVKLHPYLVTLVRWCVSCLWSTATVLLHRLMTTPLQPITGPKPPLVQRPKIPCRAVSSAHLHPEPKVECQLLHEPQHHSLDVIFVHGLYGSLGNTWRQGDWRQKYTSDPQKVPLRNHSTPNTCNCHDNSNDNLIHNENKCDDTNITDINDPDMSMKKINEKLSKKVIPQENDLITEQFYNNTLLDQVENLDIYETQANFVSDLYKKENGHCDEKCDENNEQNSFVYNDNNVHNEKNDNDFKCKFNDSDNGIKCEYNKINDYNECKCNYNEKKCEIGCGCICNDCYSSCWPKDWIKKDFPEARVISINYTSDPYLWRPLWIKENKRLNLFQRAEQMMEQLLDMGVGDKPIIWVGHSKGGLFIKQIYCEAYEAHMKMNTNSEQLEVKNTKTEKTENANEIHDNGITAANIDTIIGHFTHTIETTNSQIVYNETRNNDNYTRNSDNYTRNSDNYTRNNENLVNNDSRVTNGTAKHNVFEQVYIAKKENTSSCNLEYVNVFNSDNICDINDKTGNGTCEKMSVYTENGRKVNTSNIEDPSGVSKRASLWSSSRGFMFYSVPHRGSPLADIKTPVTARSVDLLEIAKDCPLVLELQERWLRASHCAGAPRISVRSFVETCRTLMSVLWLRIVSTESADAGIGTLSGIPVDHREICKPTSRTCLLYTELTDLIHDALKCRCQ